MTDADEIKRSMDDVIALSEVSRRDSRTGKIEHFFNSVVKRGGMTPPSGRTGLADNIDMAEHARAINRGLPAADHGFSVAQKGDYDSMNRHGRSAYDDARAAGADHHGAMATAMSHPQIGPRPGSEDAFEHVKEAVTNAKKMRADIAAEAAGRARDAERGRVENEIDRKMKAANASAPPAGHAFEAAHSASSKADKLGQKAVASNEGEDAAKAADAHRVAATLHGIAGDKQAQAFHERRADEFNAHAMTGTEVSKQATHDAVAATMKANKTDKTYDHAHAADLHDAAAKAASTVGRTTLAKYHRALATDHRAARLQGGRVELSNEMNEAIQLASVNSGAVVASPGATDSPVHADTPSGATANNALGTANGSSAASDQQRADTGAGIHGNPQTPTNTDDLQVGSPAWEGLRNLLQHSTDLFVTAPSLGQPFTDLIGAANAENLAAAKVAVYRLFAAAGQRYTNALIDDAVRQIASTVNDLPLYAGEDMADSPDVPEDTLQDIVADNDPDNDKDRAASNTPPKAGTQNSNTTGTYLSAASETAKAASAFLLKLSTPEQVTNAGTPGDPRMMTNAANQAGVDATTKNPVMKCPAGHDAPQGGWGDMKYCPQDGKKLVKVKPDTSNDGKSESETESDQATASAAASSGTVAASNAEIDRLVALSRKR